VKNANGAGHADGKKNATNGNGNGHAKSPGNGNGGAAKKGRVRADGQPVVGKSGWVHRGHSREERLSAANGAAGGKTNGAANGASHGTSNGAAAGNGNVVPLDPGVAVPVVTRATPRAPSRSETRGDRGTK
jgi:hypothetical protein